MPDVARAGSWTATWRRWTEPHPSVQRPSLRDRVRLACALTLALVAITVPLALLVPRLLNPEVPLHQDPAAQGSAIAVALLAATYWSLRGPRAEVGLVGLPLSLTAAIWYVIIFGHEPPWQGAAEFLVVAAGVGALVMSPQQSLFLWLLNALGFTMYALSEPTDHGHAVTILILLVLPPLLVLGADVRARQVAVIEEQAARLAQGQGDLTALLEAAPQGMLTIDPAGHILFANGPAARIFGYGKRELMSMGIEQLVPEASRAQHAAKRAEYEQHPSPRLMGKGRDLDGRRKDGNLVPLEIGLNTVQTSAGRLVVASIVDLSARLKAESLEREAVQRTAQLEKAAAVARFRADLMNMVAHELKNPLTPLRLQMKILEMPTADAAARAKAVQSIDRSVGRLDAQINHMLEASRLESGTTKLALSDIELSRLVRQAVDSYQAMAVPAELSLQVEAPSAATVRADGHRVEQMLDNLLSNAIKYTPPRGRVSVQVSEVPAGFRVAISDTGLGLTAEQQVRLFQPFSKVHQPVNSSNPSTGLGLFITKGIVELHGGRIGVESAGAGQGSTFWFELPRTGPPASPTPAPTA